MFGWGFFFNVLHVSCLYTNFNDYNSLPGSVFVHVYVNINKDDLINLMHNCLESSDNASLKDLWLLFLASILFLKV